MTTAGVIMTDAGLIMFGKQQYKMSQCGHYTMTCGHYIKRQNMSEKCFFLPLNGSNSHVKYDFLTPGGLMYSLIRKSVPDDISKKRRRLVFKTGVIIYIQNYIKS